MNTRQKAETVVKSPEVQKIEQTPQTEKLDPRIRRTRRLLFDAIVEVLSEKSLDEITIHDITGRAGLNRATFYLHFQDKYDLLAQSVTETLGELVEDMGLAMAGFNTQTVDEVPEPLVRLFEHISSRTTFYRTILSKNGNAIFLTQLRGFLEEEFLKWLQIRLGKNHQSKIPLELVSRFHAAGRLGLLTWWLDNNQPYTPREMAAWAWRITILNIFDSIEA